MTNGGEGMGATEIEIAKTATEGMTGGAKTIVADARTADGAMSTVRARPPRKYARLLRPRGKRASKCRESSLLFPSLRMLTCACRISPRASPTPAPSVPPARSYSPTERHAPTSVAPTVPAQPEPELELELSTPPPVEDTLAARRARRQAILAKYAASGEPTPTPSGATSSAAQPTPPAPSMANVGEPSQPTTSVARPGATSGAGTPAMVRVNSLAGWRHALGKEAEALMAVCAGFRDSISASPAPEGFALAKDSDEGGAQVTTAGASAEQSAADYDPSMDRREDEQKRVRGEDLAITVDVEEVEEEDDVDDVEDMFALAMGERKVRKVKKAGVRNSRMDDSTYTDELSI